jgi:hypothetical protein
VYKLGELIFEDDAVAGLCEKLQAAQVAGESTIDRYLKALDTICRYSVSSGAAHDNLARFMTEAAQLKNLIKLSVDTATSTLEEFAASIRDHDVYESGR